MAIDPQLTHSNAEVAGLVPIRAPCLVASFRACAALGNKVDSAVSVRNAAIGSILNSSVALVEDGVSIEYDVLLVSLRC